MTDPKDLGGPPPDPDRTELQPQAEASASRALSVPKEVEQHAAAPKIPGYVLTKDLGRGAFAEVWKAWQVRTRKWVAVKVFTQRGGVNWIFLQREVERLIKLDKHPNIVSLLDADLTGDPAYYVMDLLEAGSLDRHVGPVGPASAQKAADWMAEIAEALAYVHSKGLIHCDLKPANILLDEGGRVRVADFGQSRIVTDSAGALGTLFYMAPEQAVVVKDGEPVQPDVRWDIFALGTTMHAVLTGKTPRADAHAERISKEWSLKERLRLYREAVRAAPLALADEVRDGSVDEDLAAIVVKCADPAPERRYPTAEAVLQDLKARREQRPVSPLSRRPGYRVRKFLKRNAAVLAAASVVLGVFGVQNMRRNRALADARAATFATEGNLYLKAGDPVSALAYYAESNMIKPSHLAAANALRIISEVSAPVRLWAHGKAVRVVAFSPNGEVALTAGDDAIARLRDVLTGRNIGVPMDHQSPVLAAAFSPDGKTVVTGDDAGAARLWDARSGERITGTLHHDAAVLAVAFNPDGGSVLTADADGAVRLWDSETGKPLGKTIRHGGKVGAVAFSPDGKTALTGGDDGTARLWNTRTGAPLGKAMRHLKPVTAAAFSPAGDKVLTASADATARLWDARTGAPLGSVMRHGGAVTAVAFGLGADGPVVLTASEDMTARLWNGRTGAPIGFPMRHEAPVRAAALSPDGKTALTGSDDKTVRLWDARSGTPLSKAIDQGSAVLAVAFSPGARRFLTGSADGAARLWFAPDESSGTILRYGGPVRSVAFSPNGAAVLVGGGEKNARLWDARTGKAFGIPLKHEDDVAASAFSPDGRIILTGSWDGTARLWDARNGNQIGKTWRHYDRVNAVAFSPDGKTVATGSDDRTARIWDPRTGESLGKPMRHQGKVTAVAFSPDGKTLITVGKDATALLWNAATGKPLGLAMRRLKPLYAAAFSPNGRMVALGGDDKVAWHLDPRARKIVGALMRHDDSVRAVAFSPDAKTILTGSADKTARLWDALTGEPIGPPLRHEGAVSAVAFSPDGRTALTGSLDGSARLWDVRWLTQDIDSSVLMLEALKRTGRRVDARGGLDDMGGWRTLTVLFRPLIDGKPASGLPPQDPAVPSIFRRSTTRHFIVYTLDREAPEGFLERIEAIREGLMHDLNPLMPWTDEQKVSIFLFDDQRSYRSFTGQPPWSSGALSAAKRKIFLYESPTMPGTFAYLLGALCYDGFFLLGGRSAPSWLSTGMGLLLQVEHVKNTPGWLEGNLLILAETGGFTTEDLVRVRDEKDIPEEKIHLYQAECYAVTRTLRQIGENKHFVAFSRYLREGMPLEKALDEAYGGLTLKDLDHRWRVEVVAAAKKNSPDGRAPLK